MKALATPNEASGTNELLRTTLFSNAQVSSQATRSGTRVRSLVVVFGTTANQNFVAYMLQLDPCGMGSPSCRGMQTSGSPMMVTSLATDEAHR